MFASASLADDGGKVVCHFCVSGDKRDPESPIFIIIVGAPIAGESDGRPHFFQHLEIVVEAAFGNADFVGAVGGCAGTFEMDEIVEPDKAM